MPTKDGYQVLELFTSQSCSSCPAADAYLEELDKIDNVIALSCNVTYWNHLHWKDTLSHQFCTDKQRDYSYTQGKGGRIFTPELMINGEKSLVGSNRGRIKDYLEKYSRPAHKLTLQRDGDNILLMPVDGFSLSEGNVVTLIAYGDKHTEYVPSGENRGRTIHYTNPVFSMKNIASNWDGTDAIIASINSDMPPAGYVILISDKTSSGKTIAAGKIKL